MKQSSTRIRNEAGTPWKIFRQLQGEYVFTVDVCASVYNAKLPRYITEKEDGLLASWANERVWCNPPFVDIPPWLGKMGDVRATPELAAFLVPVRSDRLWWMRWKPLAECHYFVGQKPHKRPEFIPPPGVKYSSNPMSLALLLFGDEVTPGLERYRSGLDGVLIG